MNQNNLLSIPELGSMANIVYEFKAMNQYHNFMVCDNEDSLHQLAEIINYANWFAEKKKFGEGFFSVSNPIELNGGEVFIEDEFNNCKKAFIAENLPNHQPYNEYAIGALTKPKEE